MEDQFLNWVKHGDNVSHGGTSASPIKIVEKFGIDGRIHRNFITVDSKHGENSENNIENAINKIEMN